MLTHSCLRCSALATSILLERNYGKLVPFKVLKHQAAFSERRDRIEARANVEGELPICALSIYTTGS